MEQFAAIPDLKPGFLEKEATIIEVIQWTKELINYINMGYRNSPPQTGINMHLRKKTSNSE